MQFFWHYVQNLLSSRTPDLLLAQKRLGADSMQAQFAFWFLNCTGVQKHPP